MLYSLPYIPLFQDLTPAQTTLLKSLFEDFSCPAGTVIFEQGDPAQFLYLILTGRVAIHYKPYDGPPLVVTRLNEGDVFGWSAVIGSPKYTSSIISEGELTAIRIHRKELWNLVDKYPETGRTIIDRLAHIVSPRWKNAHAQIQPLLNSNHDSAKRSLNTTRRARGHEVHEG
ncbi:MAG: cyclic nucleotide-binding domain-containing protein [Anaerolineales bacterium]|jgi:CRP/FNR family transcriptional regulator|nr:cyclic nucleotide-binding domain-containing protein [Anaerolineales bacterium]